MLLGTQILALVPDACVRGLPLNIYRVRSIEVYCIHSCQCIKEKTEDIHIKKKMTPSFKTLRTVYVDLINEDREGIKRITKIEFKKKKKRKKAIHVYLVQVGQEFC